MVVFVQLKEGYRGRVTEEEFLAWLKDRVARYASPRVVVFVEEMPLTEVLKIRKNELRRMAAERLGEEEPPGA